MNDLNTRLLQAHEAGNSQALAELYEQAADAEADENAVGFFLTHAYIHALEGNLACVERLRLRLIAMGREVPHH